MHSSRPRCRLAAFALILLCGVVIAGEAGANTAFCGGTITPGDPTDLANVVGDQTLQYAVDQPAGVVTCAKGYLLAKCGDHANAHKIFDKCIAAGYVGAMIWKALLLEDGSGVDRDLKKAAELMARAARSSDPAYGPIGKLHYATMLHFGRGVARDEAAAKELFEAAASQGNEEARSFLRTGYHTGQRDQSTLGVGRPPPAALVDKLLADNASMPAVDREKRPNSKNSPLNEVVAESPASRSQPASDALSDAVAKDVAGQRLAPVDSQPGVSLPVDSPWLILLVGLAFAVGMVRQRAALGRRPTSPGRPS